MKNGILHPTAPRDARTTSTFTSQRERDAAQHRVFKAVTSAYLAFCEWHPVVASNCYQETRSKKLRPDVLNFLLDVEKATLSVLKTPELVKSWRALADGKKVPPQTARHIVHGCATAYERLGLTPRSYFARHYPAKPVRGGSSSATKLKGAAA